jgi:hypothetical protein
MSNALAILSALPPASTGVASPSAANQQPPAAADEKPQEDTVTFSKPGTKNTGRLLDASAVAASVGSGLKGGETITITAEGKVVLEIKKEGFSALDRFRAVTVDAIRATTAEVSNVVSQDPSFAFKEAALLVKGPVFSGIPTEYTALADQAFLPMLRVVSIALDLKKAHDTWKDERSTRTDKAIDGGHLVTDVLGLGGAVAAALPGIGPAVSTTLQAIGLIGDVAAYGYHVMKYFRERGMQE